MTNEQREELVTRWMDVELEEADDWRAINGPITDECREGMTDLLADKRQEVECALMGSDYQIIEKEADALLAAAGLPLLDHSSADFKRLCHRLLVAKQDVLRIDQARWDGDYTERPPSRSTVAPPPPAKTAAPSKPFTEVVKLYFQENARATRTDSQVKAELERFIVVVGGDKPIGSITKADCRAYKEHMLQTRKLTLATCIKHLSSLAVLFKWAEQQGFIPDGSNPVRGLAPSKRQAKKQSTQRRPFTDAELLAIFGSPEFKRQRDTNPANYWLPLLDLFHACRREEAGQVAIKDIGEADGIPFLNITDEGEEQGLKNPGPSKRRVPIHSSLLQLGFMAYVDSIKAAGHTRLFPKLTHGSNGFSDAVGKWFSRLVTRQGIVDDAVVFHSLRHGGISKLTGAGCPQNICEMLVGHSAAGVHGQTYVHRETIPLSLLREGLERLTYPDVVAALTHSERSGAEVGPPLRARAFPSVRAAHSWQHAELTNAPHFISRSDAMRTMFVTRKSEAIKRFNHRGCTADHRT